ncbi:MAG: hypothetical protein HN353_09845 [Bdellovibrionales bacterium]|jgi:hypothetical protein|nr:hypothetical protein [Bdellovibrionales bacterium]MBT3527201.1 hypothetical protein [Bdellovibrionales bacterium]MBT7668636.1 hypothetical protein [Bdellovibrionales bacterium]MBT7765630.1 hypothetical protein [Bdellovibrionales bacterium]
MAVTQANAGAAAKGAGASKGISLGLGLGLGIYGPILLASILGAGGYLGYRYWKNSQEASDGQKEKGKEKRPSVLTPTVAASKKVNNAPVKPLAHSEKMATPVAPRPAASDVKKGPREDSTDNKIQNALKTAASKNFTLKLDSKLGGGKPDGKNKPAAAPHSKPATAAPKKPVTNTGNRKK